MKRSICILGVFVLLTGCNFKPPQSSQSENLEQFTDNALGQRIAVIDFNARLGISQEDVDGISYIFNTYFSPTGYTLVDRGHIDRIIEEQQFQKGKLTEKQMVKIGQILNVSEIVVGDVNIVMGEYNLDVRVLNVQSGAITAKEGVTWDRDGSYRTMMQQLATRLAAQLTGDSTYLSIVEPDPIQYEIENGTIISPDGIEMVYVKGTSGIAGVNSFYIGKYEVTQAQWKAVMGTNPSNFDGEYNPVERVSWNDCQEFIKKLNQLTGRTYRLPTSAEWEYAARGGMARDTYEYAGSDDYSEIGKFERHTYMVGLYKPNSLGIYDMSGNVSELTTDCYDTKCTKYILRGADYFKANEISNYSSVSADAHFYKSGYYEYFKNYGMAMVNAYFGFRLVLEP